MPNKKISQLDVRSSPTLADLLAIADPSTGYAYKITGTNLQTVLEIPNKVPYTGATAAVNLGAYGITSDYLQLSTSPTASGAVGRTIWNDSIGSTQTTLKGGSVVLKNGVDLVARVVNKVTPAATLTKATYKAVRVSGAQGQRLAIAYAQANTDNNSADTIGLVCETIAANQEGFIITVGQLSGINTTGSLQGETWADGDVLYLSPTTAGNLTNIKPTGATGHIVVIGYVEYAHAINGSIYVKIMNGWELSELHDTYINAVANNDVLVYESSSTLWKNKSIATILGYTPQAQLNGTGFVKATGTTISYDNTTYAIDSLVVHLAGAENITGVKTFQNALQTTTGNNLLNTGGGNTVIGYTADPASSSVYKLDVNGGARVVQDLFARTVTGISKSSSVQNLALGTASGGGGTATAANFTSQTFVGWASGYIVTGGSNATVVGTATAFNTANVTSSTIIGSMLARNVSANISQVLMIGVGDNLDHYPTIYAENIVSASPNVRIGGNNTANSSMPTATTASALLELSSTTKGFLLPRMTTTEKNAISTPATSLLVYDTTLAAFQYYTGSAWASLGGGGGISGSGTAGQVTYWSGSSAVTGSSNLVWDNTNARLGIGTSSPNSTLHIQGAGNTSATTALTVQNSDGTNLFRVRNEGRLFLGSSSTSIYPMDKSTTSISLSGNGLSFFDTSATSGDVFYFTGSDYTHTSGLARLFNATRLFWPTSGTGSLVMFNISPNINQTGGANGITRGLYINPTLTSAADWRTIEWSNSTGWGLYGAGSVKNYLAGNLLLNTTTDGGQRLQVIGSMRVGTTAASAMYWDDTNARLIIGNTSGTARLDIGASTTSAASLRIRSGTAPTTPNEGDIWQDGTNIKIYIGGSTKTFTII